MEGCFRPLEARGIGSGGVKADRLPSPGIAFLNDVPGPELTRLAASGRRTAQSQKAGTGEDRCG